MEQVDQLAPKQESEKPRLERITLDDVRPVVPEDGGSVFILQRNAKDKDSRKLPVDSPLFGTLDEGEAEKAKVWSENYFDQIFKDLPPEERAKIDILVVAGNASLRMPDKKNSPHKRSVETSEHILTGIKASMGKYGINENQLLNKTGKPIEISQLLDLKMFDESPEFVDFLKNKYAYTQSNPLPFWEAYEEDRERDVRLAMRAEGPDDIAKRVGNYMATLDNAMKLYHQHHPGRKVIVLANSQYDSISPTLKKYVSEQPMKDFVPVDYLGGVAFETSPDGWMSATVREHKYNVSFDRSENQAEGKKEISFADLNLESMDYKKIEEIVDKFAEKLVRHKKGALIFAGSGAGKSTICRNQIPNKEGKTDWLDADFIYKASGAHPMIPGTNRPFPWWEMSEEIVLEIEKRCAVVNEVMIEKGLWAMTTSFTPDDPYLDKIVIAMLPWEEQQKRILQKARGEFYDGGAKPTEAGFSIALGHRRWAENVAKEKNIPVTDSIDKAIDLVRSRENFT